MDDSQDLLQRREDILATEPAPSSSPEVEDTSREYVGKWNHLVSQTNWEKGKLICDWRARLVEQSAAVTEYSDEAWSRRVGNVTSQHVGRLRRVYDRFQESKEKYPPLYWSHFLAALDWPDAEMWLEGAVQEKWSVSQMRERRWEALGADESKKPREEDIIVGELHEDAIYDDLEQDSSTAPRVTEVSPAEDEPITAAVEDAPFDFDAEDPVAAVPAATTPFADLDELPEDLAEAYESFKLSILRHKAEKWTQVPAAQVVAILDSLKALALSPPDED